MIMFKILPVFFIIFLTSCNEYLLSSGVHQETEAVSQDEYFSPPKDSVVSIPNLGDTITISMGEKMLVQAKKYFGDYIWVAGHTTGNGTNVISRGFYFKYKAANGFIFYKPIGNDGAYDINGLSGQKVVFESIRYEKSTGRIGHPFPGLPYWRTKSEMDYRFIKDTSITIESDFQQFIEYQGKNGSILKYTYKESSSDLARPAFTTEFVLDLNEDSTLIYKNAVIDILEAKGSLITYKVVNNFK